MHLIDIDDSKYSNSLNLIIQLFCILNKIVCKNILTYNVVIRLYKEFFTKLRFLLDVLYNLKFDLFTMQCALKNYVFKEICNAFIYIVLTERVWLHVLLFFEIVHQWYLRNIFLKSLLSVDSLSCFEIISRTLIKNLFTNGFLELLSSAARGGRSLPREARLNGYTNM